MNLYHSSIYMLPHKACVQGHCSVCDMVVLLKFQDHSTGMIVGQCCIDPLIAADRQLYFLADAAGLRAPTLAESKSHLES